MLPELIATLLDGYDHVRHDDQPREPRLALIDAAGSPAVPEFRIVCAAARRQGLEAVHGTLDDLAYDGSTLRVHDEPVQLVYRRALLEDLDQADLVAAAPDGRVCIVNPFRAHITRISDQAVINVSAGGGLLPSVVGRHKRRLLAEEDEHEEAAHGL
jgi:hypothetical protein